MTNAARLGDSLHGDRVSEIRIAAGNAAPVRSEGKFVVYWMIASRRTERNFSLQRAIEWAALQKELPQHLTQFPLPDPFVGLKLPALPALPDGITRRWPPVSAKLLAGDAEELAKLPIDHTVGVVEQRAGARQRLGVQRLQRFLDRHLAQHAEIANEPDGDARSGLSPDLHFGHIST